MKFIQLNELLSDSEVQEINMTIKTEQSTATPILSQKFIIRMDGIPSYLIKAYDIIFEPRSALTTREIKKLTLKCWATNEFEMKNFFKHDINSILIQWLDSQGLIIDTLEFHSCELESVSFSGDWSTDNAVSTIITVCYRYNNIKDVHEPNRLD